MGAPTTPFQPYASLHTEAKGPGDARPTALQVVEDCDKFGKLKGEKILITGCTAGIGVATATALYETGAQLFLTARDMGKLDNVIKKIITESPSKDKGYPRPEPVEIHLDSLESVRKGAEYVQLKTDYLNVIINNAGIMAVPEGKTKDGFESQIGTNHFSHFLLFQLLKPLLQQGFNKRKVPSRVVCVSSAGHRISPVRLNDINFENGDYHKFISYGQSKTANVYMANQITRLYSSQGIVGLSLHPGAIATELGRYMPEEELEALLENVGKADMKSIDQGAATSVWAAISDHFNDVSNTGRYLADVGECGPMAADSAAGASGYASHAYDPESEEKLWKLSCKAVGVAEA